MIYRIILACSLVSSVSKSMAAYPFDDIFDIDNLTVRITPDLPFVNVLHNGKPVTILRHQAPYHRIEPPYDRTSRNCPPYCIQPMVIAPGVETIGELELIGYLRRASKGDHSILVIDSRTQPEFERGTIPGAVNVPYEKLDRDHSSAVEIAETMEMEFGVMRDDELWNFTSPKTLVFFCNGPWCGQSPTNIRALVTAGYPPAKIKWYRGGMQAWEQLGFTTAKP